MNPRNQERHAGVWVALPVFNEERALGPLLDRFLELSRATLDLRGMIVVDDGSRDRSAEILAGYAGVLPLQVLRHPANQGLGQTIQDALGAAAEAAGPGDVVITMDADNTQPPELIPRMIERIEAGCDVVIASRYRRTARVSGLSAFRLTLSWGALALYRLLVPIRGVRDYTSGFRAYRVETLRSVLARHASRLSQERGFASMAEILIKFAAAGARIGEVPLELRYELKGGASKMNILATVLRTARVAWRNRFSASSPPPQDRDADPARDAQQTGPPQ
jgi:dolichol-phosphate mannosyltransferase